MNNVTVNVVGFGLALAIALENAGFKVTRWHPAVKNSVRPTGPVVSYEWLPLERDIIL